MVFISNPSAQPDFLSICCESNVSPPHSNWLIICRKNCLLPARADSDKLFALASSQRRDLPERCPKGNPYALFLLGDRGSPGRVSAGAMNRS
jgi:hypothetical protein